MNQVTQAPPASMPKKMPSVIELAILATVEHNAATGAEIMKRYRIRTGSKLVRGTAYTSIARLESKGLLARSDFGRERFMPSPAGLEVLTIARRSIRDHDEITTGARP